ncbi:MAG: thioredoxin domain-containing protein [Longimicrobiales bacterium]|nr:thioredoxin domain-containing protein [Longimicrobiales bacterium]
MSRNAPATLIAALALAGTAVGTAAQATEPGGVAPTSVLERALESRAKGADSARVVVFEIADFQCPYCARFAAEIAPALDDAYVRTERIQWVFVNLPLHNHTRAWHAAEAALCAGVAGGDFWAMHDRLFAEQDTWSGAPDPLALFAGYAAELGAGAEAYERCTADDQVAPLILQDLGSAISAGITGTPTFIIMKDGQVVDQMVGVQSVQQWSEVLDGALQ